MVLAIKDSTRLRHKQSILPVVVHIEDALNRSHSLEDLAREAGFSPFHFHRMFHEVVGESPMAYIRRLRLERAVYRMKVSPDKVLQIGLEAGFQSHESFTRAFVRHYKMKPSEFRAMLAEFRRCLKEIFEDHADWDAMEHPEIQINASGSKSGFRLEQIRGQKLLFKRYRGPYQNLLKDGAEFNDLWMPLIEFAESEGLKVRLDERIGITHDDPFVTDEEKIRFDACLAIGEDQANRIEGNEEIGVRSLAGGLCSVRQHFKGFEEIEQTFAFIGVEWIPAQRTMLEAKAPFEIYQCKYIDGNWIRVATDSYVPLKSL